MKSIQIEGNVPLHGAVSLSGATNSAIKLMFAAMFSNDDVVLENVPDVYGINGDIEILKSIGGKAEWIGNNRLLLNGSGIKTFEIPYDIGSKFRTTLLLAGPLLFRFGKAKLPRFGISPFAISPVNRWVQTWESLGVNVIVSDHYIYLNSEVIKPGNINFKVSTHMGTDNALLTAAFIEGETSVLNASEEPEITDLINLLNILGAEITQTEPRKIIIKGSRIFRGGSYEVMPSKNEAVFYATAAIMTGGNIIIKNIVKESLVQYVNFLTKIGVNYEFGGDELRIWNNTGRLEPFKATIVPSPGLVPDWQPFITLTATKAEGESFVHDTVYHDHFLYAKDLNIMGADIELLMPSSRGIIPVISDDSYDFDISGEPYTLAKIKGNTQLKGKKIQITDPRVSPVYVMAALAAEGKTEFVNYDHRYDGMENLFDKLESLGARIYS